MLAAVLAWAPMPFGSVVPWSEALLLVAVAVLAAAGAVLGGAASALRALRAPLLALLALAAFAALQAAPWPRLLARAVSPAHVRLTDGAQALLGASPGGDVHLSLAPWASAAAAVGFLGAAAALFAGATLGRERAARRGLLGAVLGAAVFEAFVGAQLWFARSRTIWGVEVPTQPWRLHGTFVNPDHLASYLELALALALAWIWWAWRRGRGARFEERLMLLAPPAVVWLALVLALAFTGSRAGLLGALAGGAAEVGMVALARRRWLPLLAGGALAAAGIAAIVVTGPREGLGRFAQAGVADASLRARLELARGAVDLWKQFPWLGSGLASFPESLPLVEPASLTGAHWTHAHNAPAELLATGGVLAVALAAAGLVLLVRRLWRAHVLGARSEDRAAALAACGALASLVFHDLFEFGLTMPANALTLAVLCGAAAVVPRAARPRLDAGVPA